MSEQLIGHPQSGLLKPEFYAEANCRGSEAHQRAIEIEADGHNIDPDTLAAARVKCMGCVVMNECMEYGLRIPSEYGIYGGLPQRQRKSLSRELNIQSIKRPRTRGRQYEA